MILTIYDLSGIQNYIFASNKLTEMIGASEIVHRALFHNIPNIFGEGIGDWKSKKFSFDEDADKNGQVVYIGGGSALVAYKNEVISGEYTKLLQKLIFEQAGTALKLCYESIEVTADTKESLVCYYNDLMENLDRNKCFIPDITTAKGFSINTHDNSSFEPILLFGNKVSARGAYLKNSLYKKEIKDKNSHYTDNFDLFKNKDSKNYLAVIHIDGNTMGMKIREFVEKQEDNLILGLNKLKKLSQEISETYERVLNKTIEELYDFKKLKENEKIPFRPIIADGDDITIICDSSVAFEFTKTFIQKLELDSLESIKEFKLTASAGMAFVKIGFPFYTAYDIAEQCCKNAKKVTLERGEKYGFKDKSSFDFHVVYGGMTNDVAEFRKSNYLFEHKSLKYILNIRPYTFGTKMPFDFEEGFEKTKEVIFLESKDEDKFARSKLKRLRNEYGKGVLASNVYWNFMLARYKGYKGEETAELISTPFFKIDENDEEHYAMFFDVLDVLDFEKPKEKGEAERRGDDENAKGEKVKD